MYHIFCTMSFFCHQLKKQDLTDGEEEKISIGKRNKVKVKHTLIHYEI